MLVLRVIWSGNHDKVLFITILLYSHGKVNSASSLFAVAAAAAAPLSFLSFCVAY